MNDTASEEWFENFAYNLIWLRKYYGISKKRMAQLLHIGIGSLNKIERGEMPPMLSVDIVFQVYVLFHVRPNELFSKRITE